MPVKVYRPEGFGKLDPFGVSVLVLGESSFLPDAPGTLPDDHNERIIESVSRREKDNTITKAVGVFYGGWRSWEQRAAFWQSVAFANFVQTNLGGSRKRPSDADWQSGIGPFWGYLSEVQPDFVLVLGLELWSFLPQASERTDDPVLTFDGDTKPYRLYPRKAGYSLAFAVPHPAWPNFSYKKWTPWVLAAIEKQRELACSSGNV